MITCASDEIASSQAPRNDEVWGASRPLRESSPCLPPRPSRLTPHASSLLHALLVVLAFAAFGESWAWSEAPALWEVLAVIPGVCVLDLETDGDGALLASGWGASLYRLDPSGAEPRKLAAPLSGEWLNALTRLPDGRILVCGSEGGLFLASGSGESIEAAYLTPGGGWFDAAVSPGGDIVAVGMGGALSRSHGAAAWEAVESGVRTPLLSLDFADRNTVFAAGAAGALLRSPDRGRTWAQQPSPTRENLNCLRFRDPRVGWFAGRAGAAAYTNDGGRRWIPVETGFQGEFSRIAFDGVGRVYLAGEAGVILRGDGERGAWKRFDLPRKDWIHSMLVSGNVLFVAGTSGRIWWRKIAS